MVYSINMEKIPITLKLKRKVQKQIAYAQDVLVEELYKFFPNAIIHGGTAIWRCYNGNRFSEDIDAYLERDEKRANNFFNSLEKKGFIIKKRRIKQNSIYSELVFDNTSIRFEATFQTKKAVLMRYETSEGFYINVYTLSAEELIKEKVETYLKRRKIRDLYDIFFLLSYAERSMVERELKNLIKNFQKPVDEENLVVVVISGAVPNSTQLLEAIQKWAK